MSRNYLALRYSERVVRISIDHRFLILPLPPPTFSSISLIPIIPILTPAEIKYYDED